MKEIVASGVGGAVGGAVTGATLGAGSAQGAILAAGITGGILGETTAQTVTNAATHGTNTGAYDYDVPSIAVGGLVGTVDAMTGGLVGDVAGSALKEGTKAVVTEGGLMPVKLTVEVVKPKATPAADSKPKPVEKKEPRSK